MRTAFSTLAVAALVLLAGCAAPFAVDAGTTDVAAGATDPVVGQVSAADGPVIGVSATGRVSAEADLAVVRVSVTATEDTAEAARAAVAADSERMRTALRDAGVADDAVRTTNYAIYPQYDYRSEERELTGYRAVHAYTVEVAPDRAGDVVDVAVGNGASTVDGVIFTLSEEVRADLRSQALTEAMTTARADADAIAAAADLSVTGVREASTVADYGYAPVYRAAESDAGGSTTFEPGPVTVTAMVQVTYAAN
jgi:uncharacterized protein YggE